MTDRRNVLGGPLDPCGFEPMGGAVRQTIGGFVECDAYDPGEFSFVHRSIPRAARASASACAAREQCVFTLPSEQPMASAVSATFRSSQ